MTNSKNTLTGTVDCLVKGGVVVSADVGGVKKNILCKVGGRIRMNRISILLGDKVEIVSDQNFEKGIVKRRL